eukprot:scaffold40806_cov53-Attheya_sp.AAC.7
MAIVTECIDTGFQGRNFDLQGRKSCWTFRFWIVPGPDVHDRWTHGVAEHANHGSWGFAVVAEVSASGVVVSGSGVVVSESSLYSTGGAGPTHNISWSSLLDGYFSIVKPRTSRGIRVLAQIAWVSRARLAACRCA